MSCKDNDAAYVMINTPISSCCDHAARSIICSDGVSTRVELYVNRKKALAIFP